MESCGLWVSGCFYSTLYPTLSGDGTAGRGWGTCVGVGFGVEEVVEHLGEESAAGFFFVFGGGEFCDGCDGAEVAVEDEVFDQVAERVILRGGGGAAGGGEWARLAGEEASDDL